MTPNELNTKIIECLDKNIPNEGAFLVSKHLSIWIKNKDYTEIDTFTKLVDVEKIGVGLCIGILIITRYSAEKLPGREVLFDNVERHLINSKRFKEGRPIGYDPKFNYSVLDMFYQLT